MVNGAGAVMQIIITFGKHFFFSGNAKNNILTIYHTHKNKFISVDEVNTLVTELISWLKNPPSLNHGKTTLFGHF